MREPGEDDEVGEYHQMALGEQPPEPTLGMNFCGCAKPPGCWGCAGFHLRPNPAYPESVSAALVYERCPAYGAAVERGGGYEKKKRGRRRGAAR